MGEGGAIAGGGGKGGQSFWIREAGPGTGMWVRRSEQRALKRDLERERRRDRRSSVVSEVMGESQDEMLGRVVTFEMGMGQGISEGGEGLEVVPEEGIRWSFI